MRKSKRAKALDIPLSVRMEVYERSGGKCETCGKWCDDPGYSNSHYIPRSQGGLGIKENILHQCERCHYQMDHATGVPRRRMKALARLVLVRNYGEFEDEELKYKKGVSYE